MQQRGVKENVMNLKACGRCGGDQIREEVMGDAELVCLQCGQRESAPSDKLPRST
jgi:DNA-directed RNA polymerase subunit RPC12/RpoP